MKNKVAILISLIEKEWVVIEDLFDKLKATHKFLKVKDCNEKDVVHGAYILHNLYCAYENIFKNIAVTFENQIEDLSKYHLELLKRMTLEIYKIRPRFLSDQSFNILDEIRKFRHLFRHAYDYELDREKILSLINLTIKNSKHLNKDKDVFVDFLIDYIEKK